MDAGRFRATVAAQIAAQLTTRRFDTLVYIPFRRTKALGPQLKVMDHRFHALPQFRAGRRHNFTVAYIDRAGFQPIQRLLNNPHTLAEFLHPAAVAAVHVPIFAQRHVKIIRLIAQVGLRLANVPINARAAQTAAG
jgi:hypothetical protein